MNKNIKLGLSWGPGSSLKVNKNKRYHVEITLTSKGKNNKKVKIKAKGETVDEVADKLVEEYSAHTSRNDVRISERRIKEIVRKVNAGVQSDEEYNAECVIDVISSFDPEEEFYRDAYVPFVRTAYDVNEDDYYAAFEYLVSTGAIIGHSFLTHDDPPTPVTTYRLAE